MSHRFLTGGFAVAVGAAIAVTFGPVVSAEHGWGPSGSSDYYHWARNNVNTEIPLTVVNSTTDDWDLIVGDAVGDWSESGVLNMVQVNGSTSSKDRRQCNAPIGMIRICNLKYGQNGWLGIAGIAIDANDHIVYGYTKLNDSYLNSNYAGGYYNTPEWRQSVACQELGHDVGLGHVDENFSTWTNSCMDYQDPPYAFTNQHDFEMLNAIYDHEDSYNSYFEDGGGDGGGGGGGGGGCNAPQGKGCNKAGVPRNNGDIGWGMSLGRRGAHETFIRIDPDGTRHLTHVRWVDDHDHH